jgi:hypothetical protein
MDLKKVYAIMRDICRLKRERPLPCLCSRVR